MGYKELNTRDVITNVAIMSLTSNKASLSDFSPYKSEDALDANDDAVCPTFRSGLEHEV